MSHCFSERKTLEAESHSHRITLDSAFVYQAVAKGQLFSKNSLKAESSDNLRCLKLFHVIMILDQTSKQQLRSLEMILSFHGRRPKVFELMLK